MNHKIELAAKSLQLEHLLDRKPANLSGGQRQRVAIGRSSVRNPEVFLFDEPLSNLDAELRVNMRREIARLHKELDSTMIYVTHDQVEAMTLADKIVVLSAGKVEQVGTPLDLYLNPDNLFVAGFIGSPKMNFIKGHIAHCNDEQVTVELHNQTFVKLPKRDRTLAVGESVTLGVRPEHMSTTADKPFTLQVIANVVENLGGHSFLYTDFGGEPVSVQMEGIYDHNDGGEVLIGAELDNVHMFDESGLAVRAAQPVLSEVV
jgi:multiple sugar transport system ATP-binding protein